MPRGALLGGARSRAGEHLTEQGERRGAPATVAARIAEFQCARAALPHIPVRAVRAPTARTARREAWRCAGCAAARATISAQREGVPGLTLARLLVPGAVVVRVTAIPEEALRARGIRGLIIDLDNTLAHWNESGCATDVADWLRRLKDGGIGVCIVSNNGVERVRTFCEALDMDLIWIAHAGKPARRAYQQARERLGVRSDEVAVIGDQIFTDVFGGNRAGLFTVLVRPLGRREFPATRLVRMVEGLWLRRLQRRGALQPL